MQTQRCTTCGQEWWDAHACPLKLTAALPVLPGRRIDFPTAEARAEWLKANLPPDFEARACACIGPQNGQPLCPCAMRGVVVKDGRYVRPEQDIGPAT